MTRRFERCSNTYIFVAVGVIVLWATTLAGASSETGAARLTPASDPLWRFDTHG